MPYSLCELMIWRRLSTLQPEPPYHLPSRVTTDEEPDSDLTKQLDPTRACTLRGPEVPNSTEGVQ